MGGVINGGVARVRLCEMARFCAMFVRFCVFFVIFFCENGLQKQKMRNNRKKHLRSTPCCVSLSHGHIIPPKLRRTVTVMVAVIYEFSGNSTQDCNCNIKMNSLKAWFLNPT